MTPKNVYIISAIIFFLGFAAGGITFATLSVFSPAVPISVPTPAPIPNPIYDGDESPGTISGDNGTIEPAPGDGENVVCPMDAKVCPDGSSVGRFGYDCKFADCPPTSGQGSACRSDSDCDQGYECIDPSPVVREGYSNLRCWRKGSPRPICLSGDTHIATLNGEVSVKNMKKGMMIWTVDVNGKKVSGVVVLTGKTFAPIGHTVVHLRLSDKRELYLSPGHKIADGRKAGNLRAGDRIEGVVVISTNLIPYMEEYTYDILPSGNTGMYFANGILLQSTLRVP